MTAYRTRSLSSGGRRGGAGRWAAGAATTAVLLLTAACTPSTPPPEDDAAFDGELRLVAFESCEAVGAALREAVRAWVGPWGLTDAPVLAADVAALARDGLAVEAAPPPAAGRASLNEMPAVDTGGAGRAYSGTTVHEAGVDEPDLVKTDGRRIVTISNGVLRVVDAQRQVVTGALPLSEGMHPVAFGWQPADLLLDGDRALVLLHRPWWYADPVPLPEPLVDAPPPMPVPEDLPAPAVAPAAPNSAPVPEVVPAPEDLPAPKIEPAPDDRSAPRIEPAPDDIRGPRLLLVDLSGQPRVISEYGVDGALVDARAVGPVVRVVVRSTPRITPPVVRPDASMEELTAAFRRAVDEAPLEDWLPRWRVRSGGTVEEGTVDCGAVTRPPEFSGTSMITVLTFDLREDVLGDGDPLTVVADADTVYSNGTSLYVAGDARWRTARVTVRSSVDPDEPVAAPLRELVEAVESPAGTPEPQTEIHKFDLSGAGQPRYAGSGVVPGWLINQYALSEWEGHLRVATTTGQLRGVTKDGPATESAVYVLAERGGELAVVGSVGGLGRGERIYSVRFVGPIGFVVTFRETDPLYTLDLSDPTAPRVRGELKITGFSSYLHPIGDGLLIGIGQEADERGVTQGTQVTLFDVSDLDRPTVLARHHIRYGHSEAEIDPHALLWWPEQRLLVLPVAVQDGLPGLRGRIAPELRMPDIGVFVLRVDDRGITELGVITHPHDPATYAPVRRSLVIDDMLWTISDRGMQANRLSTLATEAFLRFD